MKITKTTSKILTVALAATLAQPTTAQETRVERDMRCYEQPESCNGAMGWGGAEQSYSSDPIGDAIFGLLLLGGAIAIVGALSGGGEEAPPARTAAPATLLGRNDVAPGIIPARVTGIRADDTLNLRAGPGTNHQILTEIPPNGVNVLVFAEGCHEVPGYEFHWCPVEYAGVSGWASAGYLVEQ